MNDFLVMWYIIQNYLYLCIDVLSQNPLMYMHIYMVSVQDTIMFQWSFTFASYTIKVLILTD